MVKVHFADIGHLLRRALLVKGIDRNESALLKLANAHAFENFLRHCRFS